MKKKVTKKAVKKTAKKGLKGKQGKIASKAPPFDKITGADFKALRKNGKKKRK